jgi:hypothetical protein
MPVRELGGVRPPVRDLLVEALLPCYGFGLHRSPLEDLGIGVSSAAHAANSRFNGILPAGRARREWADCTAMMTEVCAPHRPDYAPPTSLAVPSRCHPRRSRGGGQALAPASSSTGW